MLTATLIAEAWLGTVTDPALEAVVNRSRTVEEGGKTLEDYGVLLERAFAEMHRVLKPRPLGDGCIPEQRWGGVAGN